MKKNIFIISALIIAAVILGSWFIDFGKSGQVGLPGPGISQKQEEETAEKEVILEINYGDGNIQTSSAEFVSGITALKLLQNKVADFGLSLKTTTYQTGTLVNSISGKENGQDEKYWLYYVNGQMAQVAADKQELKSGDKVEFRFEKSSF